MIVKVGGVIYQKDGFTWLKPYKTPFEIECILSSYIHTLPKKGNWYLYLDLLPSGDINCYVFKTMGDVSLWLKLKDIKSLGSKKAAVILSSYPTDQLLRIIAYGDIDSLKVIKGIGHKTANRILTELRDEIIDAVDDISDIKTLLISWGYDSKDVNKAISYLYSLKEPLDSLDFNDLVRKIIQVIDGE